MNVKNYSANKFYSIVLFVITLVMLPSVAMAKDDDWYLFEPIQTTKKDIEQNLRGKGIFREVQDSITSFSKDNLDILIYYNPISELIYKYECHWSYNELIDDKTSSVNSDLSSEDFDKSELYYLAVHKKLCEKYGKPTQLWFHDKNKYDGVTISNKSQLDTLEVTSLFSKKCYFKFFWECKDKIVMFSFDNTYLSKYQFEYINLINLSLRNNELATKKRNQLFTNIIIGAAIIFILLFIGYIFIKIRKATEKERRIRINELAKKIEKEQMIEVEKKKQEEQEIKKIESAHDSYIDRLREKWGNCDKVLRLPSVDNDINDILVFSESKHLVINKKEFMFSDILDCTVNDDITERETIQTFKGNSSATSKVDAGNMIGRSIVGGVLLGGVGAVIGGSTAKKQTIIEHGTDTSIHNKEVEHNYTIAITVKDLANPVYYLNVGNDTILKDEIASLMKIIISLQ